jgi:hypothetical protein
MVRGAYADKFKDFNPDRIFGNHNRVDLKWWLILKTSILSFLPAEKLRLGRRDSVIESQHQSLKSLQEVLMSKRQSQSKRI